MNGGWRGILFDLDGTLCDSHELIFSCVRDALRERAGFEFTRSHWRKTVGLPLEAIYAVCEAEGPARFPSYEALTGRYRTLQRDRDADVKTFPGVIDILATLKRSGWRMAVVTTKHSEAAMRAMESTGISDWIDTLVTGDQCAHYKPHPEPYATGAARLGLAARECVAIGDSHHDIESARAAGIHAAAACWGALDRATLLGARPDTVLETPEEMLELLQPLSIPVGEVRA